MKKKYLPIAILVALILVGLFFVYRNDMDNDGDFVGFTSAYGDGTRTCDDIHVDYGVCGGRDVDRDGRLNIADFGGTNGFASRYYPKTSCALN